MIKRGMTLLATLFNNVIPDAVKPAFDLIDEAFHTDEEKQKAKDKLLQAEHERQERERERLAESDKQQTALNIEETKKGGWFRAGWRPGMGWVGVIGIGSMVAFTIIIALTTYIAIIAVDVSDIQVTPDMTAEAVKAAIMNDPTIIKLQLAEQAFNRIMAIAIGLVMPIITGMLGLGVYRTYEKTKGVSERK